MQTFLICTACLCQLAAAVRLKQQPSAETPARSFVPQLHLEDLFLAKGARARTYENDCARKHSPPMCQVQQGMGNFSVHAVVSSYKEDLRWLNELGWEDNMTVYVHDRSKKRSHGGPLYEVPSHAVDTLMKAEESEAAVKALNPNRSVPILFQSIPNVGDEASAYLAFIIQKYNRLPDVTIFLQGHRCSGHSNFDMVLALPTIRRCFMPEEGYLDINTYRKGAETMCKATASIMEHPITGLRTEGFRDIWTRLFEEEFGALPTRLCWDPYAQFAVSRERIRQHPVSFYKQLFKGVVQGYTTMEIFWRTVFTPNALSWKPIAKSGREKEPEHVWTAEELAENSRYIDPRGQVEEKGEPWMEA